MAGRCGWARSSDQPRSLERLAAAPSAPRAAAGAPRPGSPVIAGSCGRMDRLPGQEGGPRLVLDRRRCHRNHELELTAHPLRAPNPDLPAVPAGDRHRTVERLETPRTTE